MEVAALVLGSGGAARVELDGAVDRLGGEQRLFERGDRHGRYLAPVADRGGRPPAALGEQAVRPVVRELIREQPQRQIIELGVVARSVHPAADEREKLLFQMLFWCCCVYVILSLRRIRDSDADHEQRILRSPCPARSEPASAAHGYLPQDDNHVLAGDTYRAGVVAITWSPSLAPWRSGCSSSARVNSAWAWSYCLAFR